MNQPARLTGTLLARKGAASPADGLTGAAMALSQPLPPWSTPRPTAAREALPRSTRPAPARSEERVAVTLRLDPTRHTRLKIFAARRNRTSQDVVTEALDAYLEACGGDCACLRDQAAACTRN
jgi:hypothetical protein